MKPLMGMLVLLTLEVCDGLYSSTCSPHCQEKSGRESRWLYMGHSAVHVPCQQQICSSTYRYMAKPRCKLYRSEVQLQEMPGLAARILDLVTLKRPGPIYGQSYCVVLLGGVLCSLSASLHLVRSVNNCQYLSGPPCWRSNTPSCLVSCRH